MYKGKHLYKLTREEHKIVIACVILIVSIVLIIIYFLLSLDKQYKEKIPSKEIYPSPIPINKPDMPFPSNFIPEQRRQLFDTGYF